MLRKLLVVTCLVVVAAVPLPSCKRACETAFHCKRTCDCLNPETDVRQECTLAFRCEGSSESCEEAYTSMNCTEMCNTYLLEGSCGVQRCLSNDECTRVVTCPILDANGQPSALTRDCTVSFACQQELSACQPDSTLPDAQLCASYCAQGTEE